ncbi:dephospho-CoA kinase [Parafrankia elaeagni]|uniref:dephospho-CoA kinase n=1 Tax=Parafrankia elaeagni TaxID=222534 RepID=UPI00055658EC|nr:dephospho-CoA kinase [Parafrankia elaeagni]
MVGLTGGIGSGKSAVSECLVRHGAHLVDADRIAREVVEPGSSGLAAVAEAFGPDVLTPDGSLDREALGRVVFADEKSRRRLEAITHPLIRAEMARRIAAAPADAVVIHDVPLLVESSRRPGYDLIVVVETPRELRLERLARRGLPADQAEARMAAQATDEQRRAVADILVDNSGTLDDLQARVAEVWQELLRRRDTAGGTAAGGTATGSQPGA